MTYGSKAWPGILSLPGTTAASTAAAEARLRHAIDSGESLDARVAMLTLLANVVEPGVVERFDLAVD